MSEGPTDKVWLVSVAWLDGPGGLIRAPTRSKARYKGYLIIRGAFEDVQITEIQVRRAADYDRHRFRDGTMPDFAEAPATVEVGDE